MDGQPKPKTPLRRAHYGAYDLTAGTACMVDCHDAQKGARVLLVALGNGRAPAAHVRQLMKVKEALLYCRQLLFEQRMTAAWLGGDRLALALALQRWADLPAQAPGDAGLDAARQRWQEEIEHERSAALDRARRDARLLERSQARLEAAEGVVAQLRADNELLRGELAQCKQRDELEGELELLRVERSQRVAAGQRAAAQESALRKRIDAEERRLAESSSQLAVLEALAEEDEVALQVRQAAEATSAQGRRDGAIGTLRAARALGARFMGRAAWLAAHAHARLLVTLQRHAAEQLELGERQEMLEALRESREALEWRVRQSKAECIVMAGAAESEAQQAGEGS